MTAEQLRRVATRARPWVMPASQAGAVVVAAYLGWRGCQMVDHNRLDIDRALGLYAIALLLLAYVAWDGRRPAVLTWPRVVFTFVQQHRIELLLLAVVMAGGMFIRLYWFGRLPPTGYIYLEEHINGGVAWSVLHGDRPFNYPIERYSAALSLWLFGPSTLGLRAHAVLAEILSMFVFYLLMREAVRAPAALFATAIFASLRALGDISTGYAPTMLVGLTFVWFVLRAVRTGNAVWYVPAAFLGVLLSYSYETWKALPLFAAAFLIFVAIRALLWPLPRTGRAAWTRLRSLAPKAVRPMVVIVVVVLIGLGPMVAAKHRGEDIYFGSLHRQEGDRQNRGTPGLLAPNADTQLKWAAQTLTPWLKPSYSVLGPVSTRGVIDKVTSMLLWVSVVAGLVAFWRGMRALFVGWFLGGVIASALLLSNFAPWKEVGFLPPAIALIGFLADDVFLLLKRFGRPVFLLTSATLAAIAVGAFYLNARTLNANAHDDYVLKEYSNTQSQLYSICDYLRHRPVDNFAFVSQGVKSGWGFAQQPLPANPNPTGVWSDFRFVCWNLQGQQVASLQEVWPFFVSENRPISLLSTAPPADTSRTVNVLQRIMPELGVPYIKMAPGKLFQTLSFDTSTRALLARQGLTRTTFSGAGQQLDQNIERGPEFTVSVDPAAASFTLSGLVYVPRALDATLTPSAGKPPLLILVDGTPSYDARTGGELGSPRHLLEGWHFVEVRGTLPSSSSIGLVWRQLDGRNVQIDPENFFAPGDTHLWMHYRKFSGAQTVETVRFDYEPHLAVIEGIRIDPRSPNPAGTQVIEERYTARWTVQARGPYVAHFFAPNESFSLKVDGREVVAASSGAGRDTPLTLEAGDHAVEVTFSAPKQANLGGVLQILDAEGNEVPITVSPF